MSAEKVGPNTIHNSYEYSQYLKKEITKDYPYVLPREGGRLTLWLAGVKKKTYIDISDRTTHAAIGNWMID